MQDKTGVTHLGFVSACERVCVFASEHFHFCEYVLKCIFISLVCVLCVEIRDRDNKDVTEKQLITADCRNNNRSITIRQYKKGIHRAFRKTDVKKKNNRQEKENEME